MVPLTMGIPRTVIAAALASGICSLGRMAAADYLGETREVRWTSPEAAELLEKAEELGSAAKMYEYVRNHYEFEAYDGARSDSVNVYGNGTGNDVDLASLLIAMLRSQGIPARYATGKVFFTYEALTSWLEIPNQVRAINTLGSRGFFDLQAFLDGAEFTHTWVQALVPLDRYRASGVAEGINCATQPAACTWVDLDPSFKLHRFRDPADLVDVSDQVQFDYDALYRADDPESSPPDGIDRANKNPLEIYEEQILRFLRENPNPAYHRKTLEDAIYKGEIVREEHGIVPTSAPFQLNPGSVSVFESVGAHDAAASGLTPPLAKWSKDVWFSVGFTNHPELGQLRLTAAAIALADLSGKELTLSYESTNFDDPTVARNLVVRLGDDVHETLFSFTPSTLSYTTNGGASGTVAALDAPGFDTEIEVEASVEGMANSAADTDVTSRSFFTLRLGGYFLIGAGGQQSGWAQVHASTDQLRRALKEVALVTDPVTGELLVDDGDGIPEPEDLPLFADAEAQRRLTGGVLAIAKNLYFARNRESINRLGALTHSTLSPLSLLGVFSAAHGVDSVDGTAFRVSPVGLLIDAIGIGGTAFKIDEAATLQPDAFLLAGHIGSSLEHEVWQELTGFEAISTIKGIQRTLRDGNELLDLRYQDTAALPAAFTSFGFGSGGSLPPGFSAPSSNDLSIFGMRLWFPHRTSGGDQELVLDVARATVDASTPEVLRKVWSLSVDSAGSDIEAWFRDWELDRQYLEEAQLTAVNANPGSLTLDTTTGALPGPWTLASPTTWQLSGSTPRRLRGSYSGAFPLATFPLVRARGILNGSATCSGGTSVTVALSGQALNNALEGVSPDHQLTSDGTSCSGVASSFSVEGPWFYAKSQDPPLTVAALNGASIALKASGSATNASASVNQWSLQYVAKNNPPLPEPFQAFPDPTCLVSTNAQDLLENLDDCFFAVISRSDNTLKKNYSEYFDKNKPTDPFSVANHRFRGFDPDGVGHIPGRSIERIREDLLVNHGENVKVDYLVPNRVARGDLLDFEVSLRRQQQSGLPGLPSGQFRDVATTYAIGLASGGYVSGVDALDPYAFNPVEAAYNMALFVREVLVAELNNAIHALSTVDPIATVTGNMYHDETDLRIKGRSGLDYVFSRTYNSIPSRAGATGTPMGRGWTHSYNMRLISRDAGVTPGIDAPENTDRIVSSIVYVDERGGEHIFGVSFSTPSIQNPRGNFDTLDLTQAAENIYRMRFRNGTEYAFGNADLSKANRVARIISITDPFGNALSLIYDSQGRLESVQDNLGIAGRIGLSLTYYPSGRLHTLSDWAGRSWQYGYDTQGRLTSVTNPTAEVTRYEYESGDALKFASAPGPDATNANSGSVLTADLDGDGDSDVVWDAPEPAWPNQGIYWSRNLGGGTGKFGPREQITWKTLSSDLHVVDLDVDGDLDMLGAFTYDLSYRLNDGSGGFDVYDHQIEAWGQPKVVSAADADGDGDPDVFTVTSDGTLRYIENRLSQGYFAQPSTVTEQANDPKYLQGFNFDGDGDEDVFVVATRGTTQTPELAWYGKTAAGWSQHIIAATASAPACGRLVDITGDGIIDVVTAGPGFVAVHAGQGGGAFAAGATVIADAAALSSPVSLVVSDLDNDGDLDVAYANASSDRVFWHENTTVPPGPLSFSDARPAAGGNDPFITESDVDFDGDVDLLAAMRAEPRIVVLENRAESRLTKVVIPEDRDNDGQGDVSTAFDYYENGRAYSNANAFGDGERLDYDLYRKRTRITDPRGFVSAHFYDENGEMTKLTEPDGGVLTFQHNPDGRRWEKMDALGFKTQFSYCTSRTTDGCASNASGNVTLEKDPLGSTIEYDYHPTYFDQLTRVKDKNGAERLFTYYGPDPPAGGVEGKLFEVRIATLGTFSNVLLQRFTYYSDGNLKEQLDFIDPADPNRKKTTTYFYFPGGLNLQRTEETGLDIGGQAIPVRTRSFTYDALGRLESETLLRSESPAQPGLIPLTTTYHYDELDRVQWVVAPRGSETHMDYDGNGNLIETRIVAMQSNGTLAPPRLIERRRYDAADRLVETEDFFGNISRLEYDEGGNLIRALDPTDASLRLDYDAMGRLVRTIDENGNRSSRVYDLAGRAVAAIDPLGNETRFTYDALGRRKTIVDPLGHTTTFGYDGNGNVISVVNANAYADPGNAALRSVEFGDTLHSQYDELGRLVRTVNARDEETRFEYDLLGNRTKVIDDKGQITQFLYDDFGRLEKIIDPVHETPDKVDRFFYDEADNVVLAIDRADRMTINTYDRLNRLVERRFSTENKTETFAYDPYGNLESIGNDEVTYTFGHDEKNRLESRTDSRFGRSLIFQYDAADRVIRKTDYQGDVTEYQYDSTNRLVAELNAAYLQASYHYDGAGRLLNRILSNGSQSDYSYDPAGRLTSLRQRTADGTLLHQVSYDEYDAVGNLKQATTNQEPPAIYSYDAVQRLLSADVPGTANDVTYTYDSVGNRKTEVTETGSRHYIYGDGNRLIEIHEGSEAGPLLRSFTYNDAGEVTSKRDGAGSVLYSLERSSQGRVAGVTGLGFTPQTLGYDPLGLRVRRTVNGTGGANQRFHLEGEHLEAIYTAAGALRAKFLRGSVIDEVVNGYYYQGTSFKPTNYTFHHDPLQSVVGISDPTGGVTQTLEYGPFGNLLSSTGTSSSTLRYTGREHDSVSGLYYYRARYYDPEIGRFLSEDPKRFDGGDVNLYAYVQNNPIGANDPRGDCPQCIAGAIVGAAGGLIVQVGADAYHGRPSSPAQYAGAVLGGAAGGVAAVTCGAACAGAIGGAVGNTTTQLLEGSGFSIGSVLVDATIGAIGGKILGEVAPTFGKKLLSNRTKGKIGEYLTELDLRARGNTITEFQPSNGVGRSTFDFEINGSQFAEAKFGTGALSRSQRIAAQRNNVEVQYWTYDRVSGLVSAGPSAAYAK